MIQSAQKLQQFRSKAYQLLGRGKDATFDKHGCRSGHPQHLFFCGIITLSSFSTKVASVCTKLSMIVARIGTKNMKLYLREIPTNQRPIIAGDHTPWPRTEAPTLKDRTR